MSPPERSGSSDGVTLRALALWATLATLVVVGLVLNFRFGGAVASLIRAGS